MKKSLLLASSGFILILIIILFRMTGGISDRSHLFPSYRSENVSRISSPEGGWDIIRDGEEWNWEGKGSLLPARREAVEALLNLPAEFRKHEAGSVEGSEYWLPDSSLTLEFTGESGKALCFQVFYDGSQTPRDPGGLYVKKEGSDRRIYYHPLPYASLLPWDNLINTRIFPNELRPEDILYVRLYTSREGIEARQYRYELEKNGEEWTYRGDLPGGVIKEEEVHLFLLSLASLEGDLISYDDTEDSELRFRIEIHDNRGNLYILTAGDTVERNGTLYYKLKIDGKDILYLMTREKLSAVARPLSSLLEN